MSTEIDNRAVRMTFDNAQFERGARETMTTLEKLKASLDFRGLRKGLSELSDTLSNMPIKAVGNMADMVSSKFSVMGTAFDQFVRNTESKLERIAYKAVDTLNVFRNSIQNGFSEYETQINAVQTIWANTKDDGKTLDDITKILDELNVYADKTIYNFSEMTKNIGTFTAAGVELETASKAIQGIANLGALSGSTSRQVSTAMYQLSQALAAGRVTLMDWNSVVNAGMGGKVFQKVLIETASEMGTISSTLAEGLQNGSKTFRETVTKDGWITSEVLTAALSKFTDTSTELGRTATEAATKVRTFTQLIETVKESIGSGWAQSWEYIIGDFESAKTLFTDLSDAVSSMLQPSIKARNDMLAYWSGANAANAEAEKVLREQEEHQKKIDELAKRVINGEFGNVDTGRYDALSALGVDYREVQNTVDALLGIPPTFEIIEKAEQSETETTNKTLSGREKVLQGLTILADSLVDIMRNVKLAFQDVFPPLTGFKLTVLSEKFLEFAKTLDINRDTLRKVRFTFNGVFSIFKIAGKTIAAVGKGILNAIPPDVMNRILNVLSNIGTKIFDFSKRMDDEDFWEVLSLKVTTAVETLFHSLEAIKSMSFGEAFKSAFSGIKNIFSGIGENTGGEKSALDAVLDFLHRVLTDGKIFDALGSWFETIKHVFNTLWEDLNLKESMQAWDPVTFFITLGEAVKNLIQSITLEDVKNIGIIALIFELRNTTKQATGLIKSVKNVYTSIGDLLGGVVKRPKINWFQLPFTMKAIAESVALLSASIWLLSKVPSDKAWENVKIIAAVLAMMVGTIGILKLLQTEKAGVVERGYLPFLAAMIILVAAINSLALRAAILGKLDKDGDVWKGLGMLGAIAAGLLLALAALRILSKMKIDRGSAKSITKTLGTISVAFIALSIASSIIIPAAKLMSDMSWGELGKAVVGTLAMFGVMWVALWSTSALISSEKGGLKRKDLLKSAAAMVSLATAIKIISGAVETIGAMDSTAAWNAVGVLSVMTVVVSGILGLISKLSNSGDILATSGAIIGMALVVKILASSIIQFSGMPIDTMWEAFGVIAGLVGVMSLILGVLSKLTDAGDLLLTSGAILLVAFAVKVMAESLATLATSNTESLSKGVKAIRDIAIAMGVLVGVFVILSAIPALGLLVPVVIAAMALLMASLSLVITALSKFLDSFAGFTKSLIDFTNTDFSKFGENVAQIIKGLDDNLLGSAALFGKALKLIAKTILENAEGIGLAIGAVVASIIYTIVKMLEVMEPVLAEGMDVLVRLFIILFDDLLGLVVTGTAVLVYWLVKGLMMGLTSALRAAQEEIEPLITALNDFLNAFGDALIANGSGIHSGCQKIMKGIRICLFGSDFQNEYSSAMGIFLGGVISAAFADNGYISIIAGGAGLKLAQWLAGGINETESEEEINRNAVAFGEKTVSALVTETQKLHDGMDTEGVAAGDRLISSLVDELIDRAVDVYGEAQPIGEGAGDAICEGIDSKQTDIETSGELSGDYLTEGISRGINSGCYDKVLPSIDNMTSEMVKRANSNLKIESPSKVGNEIGSWFTAGVGGGVHDGTKDVTNETDNMATAIVDTLTGALGDGSVSDKVTKIFSGSGGITGIIENGFSSDSFKEGLDLTNITDDLGLETTITPVMDMSNVYSGVSDINSMFGSQSLGLSDLNSSLNTNLSIDKIQNGSYDGSNVVASIAKLDARMDALASAISSIQIRMDTGALVGSIAGPMDTALGQRAIYAGRGIR